MTAPLAAVIMAGLLYTYSVTSIRAAKRNAQLHREADGGQLDMRKESLRRHGALDRVEGTKGYELFRDSRSNAGAENKYLTEGKAKPLGTEQVEEEGRPRTKVEGGLEEFKGLEGREALVKKMREEKG